VWQTEGSNVQRAIPPDLAQGPAREGAQQHVAIGDLHLAADNFSGAVEAYAAALQRLGPQFPAERCQLLEKIAEAESHRGEFDSAMGALRQARAVARLLRDPRVNARLAARLAHLLSEIGQYRSSRRYALYSYRVLRDTDDHRTVGQVAVTLGLNCARLGRTHEAIDWLQNAAATFRRIDDVDGLVTALNNLGLVYKNLREWREALLAREFLGELALDRGDGAEALAQFEPALEAARGLAPQGDLVAELETRTGLAALQLGRTEEAQSHLLKGMSLAEQLGDRIEQAIAERALGRLDAVRGNPAGLEVKIRSAAQCFENLGESYELATTLAEWAEHLLLLPASTRLNVPLEPVDEASRRAATLYRQLGVVPLAAESLLVLGRLEAERERYDQALGLLEQAEQWLSEDRDPETEDRAGSLRRELERQYVAVSLSTCNEFRALEDANRLFRETSDMDGLLSQTVKLAVENAGGDRGFVAFTSGAGRLDVVAQQGLGRDRARRILRVMEGVGGTRIAENGPLFSSRVAADPRFNSALLGALEGVGSLVCVPLNFPSQSVGLVYVDRLNDNLPGPFRQPELNLLAVLANSAAVAIVEAQRSLLLVENRQLRYPLKPVPGLERVVTESRDMGSILKMLSKVGDSSATVLFMGETGTGKGLLAQVVHEISNRRDRAFVQVNCAALPESLLESELFGYAHGAFTGAVRDKVGLFEEADGGTIFLDEIEKVPESVQAKLLHVLDRSEIRPVGATRSKKVDARVICATGIDLRERIKEGRFLEDLYYRLNDITVRVPALRERREDIPVLAQHFLTYYSRQVERRVGGFSPEVLRIFLEHEWRGNVRELEKTVKRMVVLADDGDALGVTLLPLEMRENAAAPAPAPERPTGSSLRSNVTELERRMIAQALG